jgi:hypothetical protein
MSLNEASGPSLDWTPRPSIFAPCPVCEESGAKSFRVSARAGRNNGSPHDYFVCHACRTVFPHPFEMPAYGDDYGLSDFARLYCQLTAGIAFMTRGEQGAADRRLLRLRLRLRLHG